MHSDQRRLSKRPESKMIRRVEPFRPEQKRAGERKKRSHDMTCRSRRVAMRDMPKSKEALRFLSFDGMSKNIKARFLFFKEKNVTHAIHARHADYEYSRIMMVIG